MDENKVAIDDLYAYVLPHESEWQLPRNVHFSRLGYGKLADQVAESIAKALAAPRP
jgi:lysophospholipase L1-like esterase